MVRPDDYVPPGARPEPPPLTASQRFRARYGDRLLASSFFAAGVAVWTVVVAGRGLEGRWGFSAGALVTMGLFGAVRPAWGFAFGERWTYREEPEPSPAYLFFTRAFGIVAVALGLLLGFVSARRDRTRCRPPARRPRPACRRALRCCRLRSQVPSLSMAPQSSASSAEGPPGLR